MNLFIMHEKMMDVCFEIVKIQYRDDKVYKLKGTWWNLGYTGNPYVIDRNAKITIKAGDWNKWKKLTLDKVHTKRTESGVPK